MENGIKSEYEIVYQEPRSVQMVLDEWCKLVKDFERKQKREERLKKINELNAKYK